MADTEEKKPPTAQELAATERERIKVTTPPAEEKGEDEKGEDDTEEKTEEDTEEKTDDVEGDKTEETTEEAEGEKKEPTEEEKATAAAAAKAKEQERIDKRIGRETAKRKAAEETVASLQKEVEELKANRGDGKLTEEEVQKRAKLLASQQILENEFVKTADRLFEDAVKVDKDFKKEVDAMAGDIGPLPSYLVGMLGDLPNGGAVLSHLTKNVDDAEALYELVHKERFGKLGLELGKLSDKLATAAKPKPKPISNAPAPLNGVGGNAGRTENKDPAKAKTTVEYVRIRNQQEADKRKERGR